MAPYVALASDNAGALAFSYLGGTATVNISGDFFNLEANSIAPHTRTRLVGAIATSSNPSPTGVATVNINNNTTFYLDGLVNNSHSKAKIYTSMQFLRNPNSIQLFPATSSQKVNNDGTTKYHVIG